MDYKAKLYKTVGIKKKITMHTFNYTVQLLLIRRLTGQGRLIIEKADWEYKKNRGVSKSVYIFNFCHKDEPEDAIGMYYDGDFSSGLARLVLLLVETEKIDKRLIELTLLEASGDWKE